MLYRHVVELVYLFISHLSVLLPVDIHAATRVNVLEIFKHNIILQ